MPRGRTFTPEFKEQAAKRVVDNSLPIAQVAREIDVNDTTLGFWVKAYRKKMVGQPVPADMPDQERIRELERRNREDVFAYFNNDGEANGVRNARTLRAMLGGC